MSAFLPSHAPRSSARAKVVGFLRRLDWLPLLPTAILCAIGLGALYSAAGGDVALWVKPQAFRLALGVLVFLLVARISLPTWYRLAWPLWFLGLGLLLAVAFAGTEVNNAQRWLRFPGGLQIQPSELMRIALVLVLARWFHGFQHGAVSRRPWLLIPAALLIGLPIILVLNQPDLGTSVMMLALGVAVIFVAGLHLWYFVAGAVATGVALPFVWQSLHDYQQRRLLTFLNPEADPLGAGYHILQSKIALGSGGLTGKGFLSGTQNALNFLPEKHTDFVFTTLAEEFGLVAGITLLALYGILFMTLLWIAWRCRSNFARILVVGLCINLALYVFINIGMVSGLLPVVGVPLPLVSYGGTVILSVFISLGLVLSASRARDDPLSRGGDET